MNVIVYTQPYQSYIRIYITSNCIFTSFNMPKLTKNFSFEYDAPDGSQWTDTTPCPFQYNDRCNCVVESSDPRYQVDSETGSRFWYYAVTGIVQLKEPTSLKSLRLHYDGVLWRHAPKRLERRVRMLQVKGYTYGVPKLRGRPRVAN